jgi:hypothetical protein
MVEYVGVAATGVLERVRKNGHPVEGFVRVNAGRDRTHGGGAPRRAESDITLGATEQDKP